MRLVSVALASLLLTGTSAFSQTQNFRGTVDEVTPAQLEKARAAATHAGYRPRVLQFGQDGNLFFTADREGKSYDVTVSPSGQVFASTGLPENQASN